jgi:hypothetical protein
MPGRKFTANSSYRYGFNGQEKSTEVNGSENLYTAEFWQHDSRIGRRWNLDPKPTTGISQYSTFDNNPIFYNDPNGDTTYVYNQNGLLKKIILDKLSSNEIIFMRDKAISRMMNYAKTHTDDQVATAARQPHNNIGRITSATTKELISHWTNTKAENGGGLYQATYTNKGQIQPTVCKGCGVPNTKFGGELDVDKLKAHINQQEGYGVKMIGYWHSHPDDSENPVGSTQPSGGNSDKAVGSAINQFSNGGIGIIVSKNSITIYPLNDISGQVSTDVSENSSELNLFNKQYKFHYTDKQGRSSSTSGTATYPSYDVNVSPVKRSSE